MISRRESTCSWALAIQISRREKARSTKADPSGARSTLHSKTEATAWRAPTRVSEEDLQTTLAVSNSTLSRFRSSMSWMPLSIVPTAVSA